MALLLSHTSPSSIFMMRGIHHGFAGDIVTAEQSGKLLKVVPEMDGHRLELQWAVAPETKAYKTFPCSYLRSAFTPFT